MGMRFRLNLKCLLPFDSPFPTPSSCRLSSASGRGREALFNSARLSFLSIISEDAGTCFEDPVKAYTCSFAGPLDLENDYLEVEEMRQKLNSCRGQKASCSTSHFSLLIENLHVLESTFSDSNALRLEKEIMLQLGRLGALKLFNTCLSGTLEMSNVLDLSNVSIEEHKKKGAVEDRKGKIVVRSKRKARRKLRTDRITKISNEISLLPLPSKAMQESFQKVVVSSAKKSSGTRSSSRLMIARNEAEMSRGVKVVVDLEKFRTTLEEETGQVATLKCWAEAAGVSEKVLQQYLRFGWYCRDELLRSARSLVLFLARNYRGLGVPLSDLLQAGYFGVLQGAERFDHTRGYKFSTYVQYWIRKSMSRMVSQHARGIKLPCTLSRAINRIRKARKALHNSHGKYPEDNEIAKFTGLSLAEIRSASECLRVVGSIDQKVGDSLNAKFLEFAPDMSIKSPKEIVTRQHMKQDLHKLLKNLDTRERQVLVLRYGLKDHRPKSLAEIGRLFRVSKEWIRKLEKKAMTKLRNMETCRSLSHYLEPYSLSRSEI